MKVVAAEAALFAGGVCFLGTIVCILEAAYGRALYVMALFVFNMMMWGLQRHSGNLPE